MSPVFGEDDIEVAESMPKLSKTRGARSKGKGKISEHYPHEDVSGSGRDTYWVAKEGNGKGRSGGSSGEETAWNLGAKLNKSNSKSTEKKTPATDAPTLGGVSTEFTTKRKDSGSKSWFWRATPKKLNVDEPHGESL